MGSGGLGGLFGALLQQAGADVLFIARGKHLEAMQTSGLKVLSRREIHSNTCQLLRYARYFRQIERHIRRNNF